MDFIAACALAAVVGGTLAAVVFLGKLWHAACIARRSQYPAQSSLEEIALSDVASPVLERLGPGVEALKTCGFVLAGVRRVGLERCRPAATDGHIIVLERAGSGVIASATFLRDCRGVVAGITLRSEFPDSQATYFTSNVPNVPTWKVPGRRLHLHPDEPDATVLARLHELVTDDHVQRGEQAMSLAAMGGIDGYLARLEEAKVKSGVAAGHIRVDADGLVRPTWKGAICTALVVLLLADARKRGTRRQRELKKR